MGIFYGAALVTAGLGALMDLQTHKIPNRLTLWSGTAGLACSLLLGGFGGLSRSLSGLLFSCLYLAFWFLGALKAGDIKLYMAVGAWAGWKFSLYTMIASFLTGGLAALFMTVRRKEGRAVLGRLRAYLTNLMLMRTFYCYQPGIQGGYFSFGVCIFVGTLAAFWKLYGM